MKLDKILRDKKKNIVKKWIHATLQSHSADPARFVRKVHQFNNPVVYSVSEELDGLYEEIVQGIDSGCCTFRADTTMRIRSVQDITASQAASFPLELKRIIREELKEERKDPQHYEDFLKVDNILDELTLLVFDKYMKNRETIFEIKLKEYQRTVVTGDSSIHSCPSVFLDPPGGNKN